jgi:hypothetical protein
MMVTVWEDMFRYRYIKINLEKFLPRLVTVNNYFVVDAKQQIKQWNYSGFTLPKMANTLKKIWHKLSGMILYY